MTPSDFIVSQASRSLSVADCLGRLIEVQTLTALHTLRLLKAAGPELSRNDAWISMASLAFAVVSIDGVPVPQPATEAQIEGIIIRLGDAGVTAVSDALANNGMAIDGQSLGNSLGTQS